jgi:cysteine-rich repeat protein
MFAKQFFQPLLLLAVFLFLPLSLQAETQTVLINEIAWMGTGVSASDEWIEFYNPTDQAIDLSGWTLTSSDGTPKIILQGQIAAQSYFLLERTDDNTVPEIAADQIYIGALSNSGENLILKNTSGEIVDQVNASGGWPAGSNADKKTMQKCASQWQTSPQTGGSPRQANNCAQAQAPVCGNGKLEAGEECDDGNQIEGDGCGLDCRKETEENQAEDENESSENQNSGSNEQSSDNWAEDSLAGDNYTPPQPVYSLGDVVINELVSDPTDGDIEWIELYNTTSQKINLDNWVLVDASGAQTKLDGTIDFQGAKKYFLVDKLDFHLNNAGDIVSLRDDNNFLIDKVCYGNWDDGSLLDNAPAAADPFSLARQIDGYNTFNNKNDFRLTITPTKAKANIITNQEPEANYSNYDYSPDLMISEILPNPIGSDKENEFIELYNNGGKTIDLSGWCLCDADNNCFQFSLANLPPKRQEWLIRPGQYLALFRSLTKIALNNSGDEVKLFAPLGIGPEQTVKYSQAKVGQSYNLIKGKWQWSNQPTPDRENFLPTQNHAPIIDFSFPLEIETCKPVFFDSSDTIDPDGDKLQFSWDFGDGFNNTLALPEHTYQKAGQFKVSLTVSDGQATSTLTKTIVVRDKGQVKVLGWSRSFVASSAAVIISEILPNPATNYLDEWIELKNTADQPIDLAGWQIDDKPGASRPYEFGPNTWLEAGEFLVLERSQTGIALNNSGDQARLILPNGEVAKLVSYSRAPKGKSYAFDGQAWHWVSEPTPGEENDFSQPEEKSSKGHKILNKKTFLSRSQVLSISQLADLPLGAEAKVSGWVVSLPGTLSSQYFYLADEQAGIQVYNYQRQFPRLNLGDYLEVKGKLSQINGEKRLKVRLADIKTISEQAKNISPRPVSCLDLNQVSAGQLVKIKGEITEKEGYMVFLDDGTAEAQIYIKRSTGIKPKVLAVGSEAEIVGILVDRQDGRQVLPRSENDIRILDSSSAQSSPQPMVLGQATSASAWALAGRRKPVAAFWYLAVVFGAGLIGLFAWWRQNKNRSNKSGRKNFNQNNDKPSW